ncbi:MAG: site-specific tyrosine recombinase XerD [Schlesneria sp.]|nr:site-specific tyrosine recombinase XerD [Schlesneria sp.]
MSRPRNTIPKFSVDRNGRAFTKVHGCFISLGRSDDPQSRIRYAAVLTEQASGRPAVVTPKAAVTLNELFLKYVTDELPRFSSSERHCQMTVIRMVRQLFGFVPVAEFGPLKLRAVRDAMVAGDPNQKDRAGKPNPRKPWSRNTVNRQVKRLRAIIRWGVSWEMVSSTVVDALDTVASLTAAETTAAESIPRVAVPAVAFHAVRGVLREKHRDMLDLLSLTGARPGELLKLTTGMIDRSGPIWRCELTQHKTTHRGKTRVLFFNEAAQLILRKYLQADPDAKLLKMRRDNFGHVIQRACDRANVARFCPHQIRHTVATKLVDEMGEEFAQRLLGHSKAAMTRGYSKGAEKKAQEAVKRLG